MTDDKLTELREYREKIKGWKIHLDQTHELQKEVNNDLTELEKKVKAFNNNKPIAGSNDNQGGIKIDELEQELDAAKKELANLKEKITEYEKLTTEIGGAVNDIGDKPKQIHEEQKKTKNLVSEISVGILAIIGVFSSAYWIIKGTKNWIIKKKD